MNVNARFVALVVLILGTLAWPSIGLAEKVKTNQSTKLYTRAGEQSPVLLKLKPGQTMTVLAKDGRWLKVRVSGRTGWIPRSKVDMPQDDDEISRNTRRRPFVDGRGTKRGFGGEAGPEDRVGADATGEDDEARPSKSSKSGKSGKASKDAKVRNDASKDDEDDEPRARKSTQRSSRDDDDSADDDKPARRGADDQEDSAETHRPRARVARRTAILDEASKDGDEAFTADPKTELFVLKEQGKWTMVSNDEGDTGYVLTSKLEIDDAGDSGPRTRSLNGRARVGWTFVRQSVSTPGAPRALPDNYSASSSSVTIALGGTALYPYSKRYWIGADLAYDYDKAIPGIDYNHQSISFSLHNLNLRALVGYDMQKPSGMIVFGRLGYHYESFQVSDYADLTKNTAKLPSQIISGPILGASLAIPRFTKEIGLRISLDTILFGASIEQTKNLEDGTGPSAKAVFLGASLTYRWKPNMDLQATFDLQYTKKSFSGMAPATSMRGHTGTGPSSGADFNNTISGGIAYLF
ncbi:MAG TPA: SH3 domain-containing protein [Kofleriaceae bacterium]|nr:SH3 domain-containing protein [Kofleriaceae bacterium]